MKTLKFLGMTLLMVMLAINFTACSDQLSVTYTQFDGADIYKVEELNSSTLTITSTDDDEVDTSTYKKVAG